MMLSRAAVIDLLVEAQRRRPRPARLPAGALVAAIVRAARSAGPDGLRMRDICVECSRTVQQIGKPLRRLVDRGELVKLGRGLYAAGSAAA